MDCLFLWKVLEGKGIQISFDLNDYNELTPEGKAGWVTDRGLM